MATNIAVYGIYPNRPMVEKAVEALKDAGFRHTDISVLFPAGGDTDEFAVEKETKAPEGTATGASAGAVIGGTLGWLVGIGTLAIPGLGPFIVAGPIMAALAGAGAGGLVGGIAGALIGMGIPEYEAKRYEGRIKEGGILLSVHADDSKWKNKGMDILQHSGAQDIGSKGEASSGHEQATDHDHEEFYTDHDNETEHNQEEAYAHLEKAPGDKAVSSALPIRGR